MSDELENEVVSGFPCLLPQELLLVIPPGDFAPGGQYHTTFNASHLQFLTQVRLDAQKWHATMRERDWEKEIHGYVLV
jgi:hypothetical protein